MSLPFRFSLTPGRSVSATDDAERLDRLQRVLGWRPRSGAESFAALFRETSRDAVSHQHEMGLWSLLWSASSSSTSRAVVGPLKRDLSPEICQEVVAPLIEQARNEGVYWNPVLDLLTISGIWREAQSLKTQDPLPSVTEHLELLGEWISAQREPASLKPLLKFESWVVREVMARHARVWDVELVDGIWSAHPLALKSLVENPSFQGAVREEMEMRLVHRFWQQRVESKRGTDPSGPLSKEESLTLRALKALAASPAGLHPDAHEEILRGERRRNKDFELLSVLPLDSSLPEPILRELMEIARGPLALALLAREDVPLQSGEEWLRRDPKLVLRFVEDTQDREWTEREKKLAKVVLRLRQTQADVFALSYLERESCDREDFLWIAMNSSPLLDGAVIEQERFLVDPEVRRTLRESGRPRILGELLRREEAGEWKEVFRRFAALDPDSALRILENRSYPAGVRIVLEDLAPLMSDESSEIRLRAIAWAGRLPAPERKEPEIAESQQPSPPSSR